MHSIRLHSHLAKKLKRIIIIIILLLLMIVHHKCLGRNAIYFAIIEQVIIIFRNIFNQFKLTLVCFKKKVIFNWDWEIRLSLKSIISINCLLLDYCFLNMYCIFSATYYLTQVNSSFFILKLKKLQISTKVCRLSRCNIIVPFICLVNQYINHYYFNLI